MERNTNGESKNTDGKLSRFLSGAAIPLLAFAISISATFGTWLIESRQADADSKAQFDSMAEDAVDKIKNRMALYDQALRGAQALFISSGSVSREEFKEYVSGLKLETDYPGIQGIGYSIYVHPDFLAKHVEYMRSHGFPNYSIKPAGKRDEYSSIVYLEPFDWRNQRAFGYDMLSQATRRKAMFAAMDSGKMTASGKVTLVQETNENVQSGFLTYLPIYRVGAPRNTPSERRGALIGWVYSVFRMGDLMNGVLGSSTSKYSVEIYDGSAPSASTLYYDSASRPSASTEFYLSKIILIDDRKWLVRVKPTPQTVSKLDARKPYWIACFGFAISLLLSLAAWLQANGRRLADERAAELNSELISSQKALRLENDKNSAILRSANDGIHVLDYDGKVVEASDSFCDMLGYSREEIIGMSVENWDAFFVKPGQVVSIVRERLSTPERVRFETKHRRKDGTVFDVEISGFPFELDGRTLLYNSSRDVSDRKLLESNLAEERNLNASILNSAGPLILAVDENGFAVSFNKTAEALTGASFSDVSRIPRFWTRFVAPEDLPFTEDAFDSIMAGKTVDVIENRWIDSTGEPRLISWTNSLLKGGDGKPNLLVAIGIDVTERRKAEFELKASEERLNEILNTSPISVRIAIDGGRKVVFCNKSYSELIENPNPLGDDPKGYYMRPEEYDLVLKDLNAGLVVFNRQIELDIGGKSVWALASYANTIFEGQNAVLGWFYDVTTMKRSESELRVAAAAFEGQDGLIITDEDGNILKANKAFSDITGYSQNEVVGKNPRFLQSGKMEPAFYQDMWKRIIEDGSWAGEIWNQRKNGEHFPEYLTITAVKDDNGRTTNYVGSFLDITERKISETQIRQLAYYDQLTGLPNRRLFRDRLEQDVKRVSRKKESLALLFIDMDKFKDVNDTLGHDKGDLLLVEAAKRIAPCIRNTDTFARLGGDEFTIVLPEYGDVSVIDRIAGRVVEVLSAPFDLGGDDVGDVSCSIGIALYPHGAESIEDLLKQADQAMYAAKQAGRNGFSYFTQSMHDDAKEKTILTNDLRHALELGQLEIHFQPIVEAESGEIVKAEALLRWRHPLRGFVPPDVFIPLAEESGLILKIGEWVFVESLKLIGQWRDRTGRLMPISVNKSPVQFVRSDKHQWLEAYDSSGLPKNCLTVEITEGVLISESEKVKADLNLFHSNGIEVSIDDFGTGFSSLSYLNRFDVDYLKIDKSFVQNITVDAGSLTLTEAIVTMAHKLGIKTIAEGVETEEQRDSLVEMGCDYLQGYLFSKPIPADEFEKLIGRDPLSD